MDKDKAVRLFVGGMIDGERREVQPLDKILVSQTKAYSEKVSEALKAQRTTINQETYKYMQLRGDQEIFVVYAREHMSDDDVLRMLISNYKPDLKEREMGNQ